MKLKDIKPNPNNPRVLRDDKFQKLKKSIQEFPKMLSLRPIVIDENNIVLGGNQRYHALKDLGFTDLDDSCVKYANDLTEEEKQRFIIADNVAFGEWDWDTLANDWDVVDLEAWGLEIPQFNETVEELEASEEKLKELSKKLSDRFIIPPFSVLDTRAAIWQDRKRYWLSLGIKSEIGRESQSVKFSKMAEDLAWAGQKTGISIFDPVLCELIYNWFNIPKGYILDPFAGGSVRGIVAAKLEYQYLGNDLRKEQIEANIINAKEVLKDSLIYPIWKSGDSVNIDKIANGYNADLIFSCPPYFDLEVYSDMKQDLSTMSYKNFITIYNDIIKKSCQLLNENRFAVFVVGDIRGDDGSYRNFVSHTIQAFLDAGLILYNELILVNAIGAKAIAANGYMKTRKIGKVHQNVLVFYKGDLKKIKENYPELDLSYIEESQIETS